MREITVSLDDRESRRLTEVAAAEGCSEAEIVRVAILAYAPGDRDFALAAGFARSDDDPRPISSIPENDLLDGFGR